MRYRYSKDIVYNNFIWPAATFGDRPPSATVGRGVPTAPQSLNNGQALGRDCGGLGQTALPEFVSAISSAAQAVLDARAKFPGQSLADLYDPLTMPPELVKAHAHLDALVDRAYGRTFSSDADRVAHLFALYAKATA